MLDHVGSFDATSASVMWHQAQVRAVINLSPCRSKHDVEHRVLSLVFVCVLQVASHEDTTFKVLGLA